MASFINKRQQARNERALQDLIRNVPGNDRCADCQARNPGWASWSLGIFLCMRCAALHRKLGTHISKVKSLSMDTWASDQVEAMKNGGNVAVNRTFNPRNVKPVIPLDPDEIDTAMEKFVRAKYQRRTLGADSTRGASTHNTGSTSSTDDHPPPVPEKNTPRFASALRSASSTYPVSRTDRPLPPINDPDRSTHAAVTRAEGNTEKLATLRSMGFTNETRNLTLLKALNGNVEKTIEALVRYGDGEDDTRAVAPARTNPPHPPQTEPSAAEINRTAGGIQDGGLTQASFPASSKPYNPFDPQPVIHNSTHSTPPLETSFQALKVSQQPLFPINTGAWEAQNQHNPFLKAFTPPISPASHQGIHTPPPPSTFAHNYVPQRGYTDPTVSTNPFLRPSQSQTFAPSGLSNQIRDAYQPYISTQSAQPTSITTSTAPWTQDQRSFSQPLVPQYQQPFSQGQTTGGNSPSQTPFSQLPFSQPLFQQSFFSDSPLPSPGLSYGSQQPSTEYPFETQHPPQHQLSDHDRQHLPFQTPPYQPQNAQFGSQTQTLPSQGQAQYPTPRFDKSSILALYNQPQAGPAPGQSQSTVQPASASAVTTIQSNDQSMPLTSNNAGHKNPFANLVGPNNSLGAPSHMREESKDFAGLMSRNAGRHSPDAFAGLSARYR